MSEEGLKIQFPVLGWEQFLTARKGMLDEYDRARTKAQSHKVETYQGKVAEAQFRKWLKNFLPQRYGVASGQIISQGMKAHEKAPEFDVIIYDALNAPVLWINEDADTADQGRKMALPAEHVLGVLEVKSRLQSRTVVDAISHLSELMPLMKGEDNPSERYKLYLPRSFFCGIIFFELTREDSRDSSTLLRLTDSVGLKNFYGGIVLRASGHYSDASGRLQLLRAPDTVEDAFSVTAKKERIDLFSHASFSKSIPFYDINIQTMLIWSEMFFSQFAFDMVALLDGTYEHGRLSSFHGLGVPFGKRSA